MGMFGPLHFPIWNFLPHALVWKLKEKDADYRGSKSGEAGHAVVQRSLPSRQSADDHTLDSITPGDLANLRKAVPRVFILNIGEPL